jgi:RNA polymerase sigma factor (sigma-70 family)
MMPMITETRTNLAVEYEGNIPRASDDFLTLAAKSGDGPAFVELSRRHSKKIQRLAYRILGNWEDADDVLQDSLLKAFKSLAQFRGTSSFSTWITRIAINSALMELRRRRVRFEISYDGRADFDGFVEPWDFPDSSPNPERLCARGETEELLRTAIRRLPCSCQTVVELQLATECSTNEIAQALGISVPATKSRLLRARAKLRASLPDLRKADIPRAATAGVARKRSLRSC